MRRTSPTPLPTARLRHACSPPWPPPSRQAATRNTPATSPLTPKPSPVASPGKTPPTPFTNLAPAIDNVGDFDRAESLACAPADPDIQAQALASVATIIAQAGHSHRAERLLAQAIIKAGSEIWWIKTLAQYFSSAIGATLDILIDAYIQKDDLWRQIDRNQCRQCVQQPLAGNSF